MANLNNSTDIISYKEAIITIPANSVFPYQNPYNFIRLLESTGGPNDLHFRFGVSSLETFLSVGVGLGFTELLPSVSIRNSSNSPITIRIAEIQGQVTDDRLILTGTVSSLQAPYSVRQTSQETFDSNGEIAVDSTSYKRVIIQNNSSAPIYLFQNGTFEIQPNGTFDLNYAGQYTIYGQVGDHVSLAYFS